MKTGGTYSGLSERLRAVASLVPPGTRVADIGTGHGRLPLWLLAASRATHCIATEKTTQSGSRLARLPGIPGLDIRYGEGLEVLRPEDAVEVLVLSGLGARSIIEILDDGSGPAADVERIVLQPQTEAAHLRRWLIERGRTIVDERMARDRGRFYVVIAADRGGAGLPTHPVLRADDLLEAGPCLVSSADPLVRSYWRRNSDRLERILARAPRGTRNSRARRQASVAARVLGALESIGPD